MQPIPNAPRLRFDNSFVRELPADPDTANVTRPVLGACYSSVEPTQVRAPSTVAWSREMAQTLGLEAFAQTEGFAQVFSGNARLEGMDAWAVCYGGHQFGHWAGQLGDGRAISLGELINDAGERWELQLKGAGPTPYSRSADGRAVLRSSVREFLCSEAMHHLGVPTTRALSLVTTGESVVRDMLYNGNARPEPGAVVCRVAPSFLRFGNFEIFAARQDDATLKRLLDYAIDTHFSDLGSPSPEVYAAWLAEVCRTTAEMIVHWMRVGFVHGVMNTDNMSILGLTIDYGPYGWLDDYDPNWTPNTTDAQGRRYRFGHQPQVALWNLVQLARAIEPLIGDLKPLEDALHVYQHTLDSGVQEMMAAKLGLQTFEPETDVDLVNGLLAMLAAAETDMTIFFRRLADVPCSGDETEAALAAHVADAHYEPPTEARTEEVGAWLARYRDRVKLADPARREAMHRVNPKYVLRNYLAQEAIDKAEAGDPSRVCELLEVMRHPYDEQPEKDSFAAKRPDWARDKPGCSMLSCSS